MNTQNLSTLKIHKLTQAQYERELAAGRIDENALYLTPDEEVDLTVYATKDEVAAKADTNHNHDDKYYTEVEVDNLIATIDTSISNITSGTTVVKEAEHATSADTATNATNANHAVSADSATTATTATTAGSATKATQDGNGKVISSTYETKSDASAKLSEAKSYTDTKTSGMATTTVVDNKISTHNTSSTAHSDIRDLISALSTKVSNFLDVDDTTTDQLSEVLELINNNKGTLESLTSSKVNVSDIVDNLTTSNASKVLSAKQGVALKALIDALQEAVDGKAASGHGHAISEITNLQTTLNAKASQSDLEALEAVVDGKANATHSHAIADVTGLQTALDGKAASSHGTHVTFDSTNKPKMDGTAAFGTSASVARADHVHPTDTSRASQTDLDTHVADTTKHITSTERTNWGTAYTHSQSAHAPSNAEKNQNAFSNVKVGTTTVVADSATDTFEIAAGTGISVAGDATNDKVTITNSGVIAVSTGTTNGTISVNTNGTAANIAVKGLGSAAYTDSSAYATAGHTHTVDSALSSSSTNPVQNKVVTASVNTLTSAVSANTSSIETHTSSISALQTALDDIQEITSEEIISLFNS